MNDLPVILQVHKFYAKTAKATEKLPSPKKQTLGRRTEDAVLGLLEYLVMAKNAPKHLKAPYLIKATALAEVLMFHLRTFVEEKLANETLLHQMQAELLEIQRQIGGWLKSAK